ncbi:MAG: glycosyltransferase family 2 protein [Actinomycetota bacterium]|nr:glycosyltransferase family 2 protein [Actinomycetota bacterium]
MLPAYNEAAALPHVLSELAEQLGEGYEVLVIDDGSTDDTADVAESGPCRLVRHPANRGKGVAIRTGIAQARGEYVVIMDADATYPVAAIERLVDLLADNDLVRGNRASPDESMPLINRIGNWLFNKLFAIAHGLERGDHLSGLYGLRREAFQRLGLEATGFDIETEIGIKAQARGLRVAEFPIEYLPRVGDKKLHPWRDGLRIRGRGSVLLLIYNPVVSFILPGLLFLAVSIAGAVLLSQGDIDTQYFGLSIHSFIVAALGVLAAFQLTVFGIAAALYGVEAGKPPPRWLIRLTSQPTRFAVAGIGLLLICVAGVKLLQLTIQWAGDDVFTDTRALVLATTFLVLGLQVLSAVLFISIFSGRLSRYEEDAFHDRQHADR